MAGIAAVGIHDQLTTGQTGICSRPALHKAARGVNKNLCVAIDHGSRQRWNNHMRKDAVAKLICGNVFVMLCREDDSADSFGNIVFILNSDLRLPVRQQERQLAIPAYKFEALRERMGQLNRKRHIEVSLFAGKSEHHALISRTIIQFLIFGNAAHSAGNVRGLFVQIYRHPAALRVKAVAGLRIAYLSDNLSCD